MPMQVLRDKIDGDTILTEDTKILGMVVGSVTVSRDILLKLNGMLIGDLILEEGCEVYIHGMVIGDVKSKKGYLEVHGFVNGKVIRQGGKVLVDSNAIVRDGVIEG